MKESTVLRSVVISLCLLGAAGCGGNAATDALAKRVQAMEDEKQIRDLIVDYGLSLDRKEFSGYSELFAKEGEWSGQLSGMTTIKGPETIRAAMEKNFAERVYDPERITNLHLVSNVKVTIDGDRATGYSRWTVLSRNDKDEPYVRISGRYDDVLIREDGRWKFLSRVAKREIP
jgi:3-phenylpropionate/cinnamic acid dioxygenase small subunit